MDKSYAVVVSEVVTACAKNWESKGDSNWYTNMYLDYLNNYILDSTFMELEVQPLMQTRHLQDEIYVETVGKNLLNLFRSIGNLQPMLTHEQVGEVAMRILKGEV